MHWAGSLFLCLCIVITLLLYAPLKLSFCAQYQNGWRGEVTIGFLWINRTITWPGERNRLLENRQHHTSFQVEWKPLAGFLAEAVHTISRKSRLEHLEIQCDYGFRRPDVTAYCYGFFWSILAALPQTWLAKSRVQIVPDFQNTRFEFLLRGIVTTRLGQAISITVSLIALWMHRANAQEARADTWNREEQIAYES